MVYKHIHLHILGRNRAKGAGLINVRIKNIQRLHLPPPHHWPLINTIHISISLYPFSVLQNTRENERDKHMLHIYEYIVHTYLLPQGLSFSRPIRRLLSLFLANYTSIIVDKIWLGTQMWLHHFFFFFWLKHTIVCLQNLVQILAWIR